MNQQEQDAINYQFSGYNIKLEQFDETGPAYAVIPAPHPYYRNQPLYWSKPAYGGVPSNQGIVAGTDIRTEQPGNVINELSGEAKPAVNYNEIPPIELL